jgi:hypothetical protein
MRCPVCRADNPAGHDECTACGAKLTRASRRQTASSAPDIWTGRSLARFAYLCGLWGLIPLLGLVLGPVALILGIVAWSRDRSAGGEKRVNPARAAIFLGALVLVTNWVGFSLILLGLGLDR